MFAVASALQGYLLHNMKWYERILSAVGGLLLIYPGLVTDLIGLGLVGIVLFEQLIRKNAHKKSLV